MSVPSGQRCIFCQSTYHTYRNCPTMYKRAAHRTIAANAKTEYQSEAPNVFVGHYGYPNVNVGILNVEEYKDHDDPLKWSREGFAIPKIVDLRSSLINARHGLSVKSPGMAPPSASQVVFLI